MHFAIVEDLKIDQNHLIHLIQENLEKHGETACFDCYESGEAFLEAFRQGLFNAVFMDIMLDRNGRNGIDTALELRKSAERLPIVFTTSERDYSLQGYRAHPLDYLLKPVKQENLNRVLGRIHEELGGDTERDEEEEVSLTVMQQIISEIQERYTENITLTELAETYKISTGHLSNLIKRELKLSFSEYIAARRIQRAKELLADDTLSIEQIAGMVGYKDYFYFTKVFKKVAGVSPSKYRKM